MMAETLNVLAAHSRARENYLIFLAMEKHEEDSQEKAKILINDFKDKFRVVDFTHH